MRREDMREGQRVRIAREIEIYPIGIFPAGLTGRIGIVEPDSLDVVTHVRLDKHVEALDDWSNELQVWRIEREDEGACTADNFELIETPNRYRVTVLEHVHHEFEVAAACEEDAIQEAHWQVTEHKSPLAGKEVVLVDVTEVEEVKR